MIIPGHSKNLKVTLVLLILIALGFLVVFAPRKAQGPEPRPITQAIQYFIEKVQEKVVFELGDQKDGFTPEMISSVYPSLIQEDFNNVEVKSFSENSASSFSVSYITNQGMVTLLENISRRSGLGVDTVEDIDEILNFISSGSNSGFSRITVSGEYVCLPKKETEDPVTLECALGIKSVDGKFYALDLNLLQTEVGKDLKTSDQIEVEGNLVPLEAISSINWYSYNIEGIIWVTTLNKIN